MFYENLHTSLYSVKLMLSWSEEDVETIFMWRITEHIRTVNMILSEKKTQERVSSKISLDQRAGFCE